MQIPSHLWGVRYYSVRVHPYASPLHMKVLNHCVYVGNHAGNFFGNCTPVTGIGPVSGTVIYVSGIVIFFFIMVGNRIGNVMLLVLQSKIVGQSQ